MLTSAVLLKCPVICVDLLCISAPVHCGIRGLHAAIQVLKKKVSQTKASLDELQTAKLELMQAINIFMKLCKLPKKLLQQWALKPENLKAHVEFCKKAVKDSDEQIRKESEALASRQVRAALFGLWWTSWASAAHGPWANERAPRLLLLCRSS